MKKSLKLDIFVTSLLLETKTQKHNYMINNTLDANFQIYTYLYLFSEESRQHIHKHTWAETGNNSMSIFYESTDNLLTDGLCLLFFGCILLLVCYSMVPLFCYLLVTRKIEKSCGRIESFCFSSNIIYEF